MKKKPRGKKQIISFLDLLRNKKEKKRNQIRNNELFSIDICTSICREKIFHDDLNKLIEFNLRFCRANAYISSNTDDGENKLFVSSCPASDLLSSTVVIVGKIFSSVCGKSLKIK